jgi:hypothetical protein
MESWNLAVLSTAFRTLITQCEIPMKLCLFIDGLDEYDGPEREIAKLFKSVNLSPHVKFCVSSRPHVPFEDAFVNRPKLRLQDLTLSDIQQYIEDCLLRDEMMKALATGDEEEKQLNSLVEEIGDAAQGVFLWVTLVVTSLLNGLSNHDQVSDLQRRLRALPKDLDELYQQMVLKVDGIYQEEASHLYQIVTEAKEMLLDWKPAGQLSIFSLYFAANPDLNPTDELSPMTFKEENILAKSKEMEIRLKTRCGGLLEVQYGRATVLSPDMKVYYLHRTVKDFLEARQTREALSKQSSQTGKRLFNPKIAIYNSFMVRANHYAKYQPHSPKGHLLRDQGLTYARRIDGEKRIPASQLVVLLDQSLWIGTHWHTSNLPVAVQCVLKRYVQLKLEDQNDLMDKETNRLLLDFALVPTRDSERFLSLEIISLLLKFGAELNKGLGDQSPWQKALSFLLQNSNRLASEQSLLESWSDVITHLLENGADPKARCKGPDRCSPSTVREWSVAEIIAKVYDPLPYKNHHLQRIL